MTATTTQLDTRSARARHAYRSAGLAVGLIALAAGVAGVAAPGADVVSDGWYNIRSGPGLQYPVTGQAYDPNCHIYAGGGPVHADGYVWNRVDTGEAKGWMINDDWCI